MHVRLAFVLGLVLLSVASGCSSAPPEACVSAGARLKELGSSGPRGYDSPEIPELVARARAHRDHSSDECRTANWWADDAERTRPKPAVRPASAPASVHAPAASGTVSLNAVHGCNRGCESTLDRCAASAGCSLGNYNRAGNDGRFGFGERNTVPYSCTNDPAMADAAERAMQSCIAQINSCYQVCVR